MMRFIVILLCFLFVDSKRVDADTFPQAVDFASKFHKLDVNIHDVDKTSDLCVNCHIFDASQDSELQTAKNYNYTNGDADPFSKACLMCHDGNEASLVLNIPMCSMTCESSVNMAGGNHPLFTRYIYKDGLNNPSSILRGFWKDATTVSDLLRDEKIVCISCHLPHHTQNDGFIRTSNEGSKLCLGCHNK